MNHVLHTSGGKISLTARLHFQQYSEVHKWDAHHVRVGSAIKAYSDLWDWIGRVMVVRI